MMNSKIKLYHAFRRLLTSCRQLGTTSCLCSSANLGQPNHLSHPHIIGENEVTPRITREEYLQRRNRLVDLIRKHDEAKRHTVVILSHDRSYMAPGVPFIYRQHSNMRYLCGFLENESALVLDIEPTGYSSTLFVKQHSAHENLWEGHRSGLIGSQKLTGVDKTDDIKNLQLHIMSSLMDDNMIFWYNKTKPVSLTLHEKHLQSACERISPSRIRSPDSEIDSLRLIKSPAEIDLMRICGDITSEMFSESMEFSVEHPDEHAIFAKLDYECRMRGANNLAYLPVVAGGTNSLTIHYIKNDCRIKQDELVLVDCGCDLHGYVSDVTRTWPVSGKFTEVQKQVYEAVEETYQTCLKFCIPGEYSLDDLFSIMLAMTARQLERLGVVKNSLSDKELNQMTYQVCPHHVGHWLGMDVHDTPTVSRSRKLEPNTVICIEPGMYFGLNDERFHKEVRGIGIRIEDNILITEDGYENLTAALPTSSFHIENMLALDE